MKSKILSVVSALAFCAFFFTAPSLQAQEVIGQIVRGPVTVMIPSTSESGSLAMMNIGGEQRPATTISIIEYAPQVPGSALFEINFFVPGLKKIDLGFEVYEEGGPRHGEDSFSIENLNENPNGIFSFLMFVQNGWRISRLSFTPKDTGQTIQIFRQNLTNNFFGIIGENILFQTGGFAFSQKGLAPE
jgi:hypothetical protein